MGRRKGSRNKANYRVPPTGPLSLEDRLKLIAILIVDRILVDLGVTSEEAETDA